MSSETAWPNRFMFDVEHLWNVLFKVSSFCPDQTKNMAVIYDFCFWWADLLKNLLLNGLAKFSLRDTYSAFLASSLYKFTWPKAKWAFVITWHLLTNIHKLLHFHLLLKIYRPNRIKLYRSIYWRFFTKFPPFMMIIQKTLLPWKILVSDWLIH